MKHILLRLHFYSSVKQLTFIWTFIFRILKVHKSLVVHKSPASLIQLLVYYALVHIGFSIMNFLMETVLKDRDFGNSLFTY